MYTHIPYGLVNITKVMLLASCEKTENLNSHVSIITSSSSKMVNLFK